MLELPTNHGVHLSVNTRSKPAPTLRRPTEQMRSLNADAGFEDRAEFEVPGAQPRNSRAILFVMTGPHQGALFPVGRTTVVGRSENVDACLLDVGVSRRHARISRAGFGFTVEDLGSRNGTFVNDVPVQGSIRAKDGDHVRFGRNTVAKLGLVSELEERALMALYESTLRDPLTRLYNRRHFEERLYSEHSFAQRHGSPLALLMIDLDHFKDINDEHGHPAGDVVLRVVAAQVQRMMRPEDVVARYGGEEIVVIIRETNLRNAEILAERVRAQVESLAVDWNGKKLRITCSIGVTASEPEAPSATPGEMVGVVDEALYEAKRAGRNRVRARQPSSLARTGTRAAPGDPELTDPNAGQIA